MIHQYKMNGYNIVLDVYSASVHVTDDLAYDAIRLLDEGKSEDEARAELKAMHNEASEEDIDDTFSDIRELKDNGKLFTEDVYEKAAGYLKKQTTVVKALCLLVAHTCNLNCSYCFASQGK
ncbi:MAG: thioether cross-link-forming SCIFF peptide maturase, partial [Oribacterium sp.]|nr:thioether cross-link-forming SCIFF peptide maturase [Oribacterium sp.]